MKKPVIDRNRPLGLYLHIPFCKAKCAYCDFYSQQDAGCRNAAAGVPQSIERRLSR